MRKVLAVGFGGIIGTLLRVGIFELASSNGGLWLVNLIGSFIIGYASVRFQKMPLEVRLFFSTGLIGSFTTFSAFSVEWFRLLELDFLTAVIFAVSMTFCSVLCAAAGAGIGKKSVTR